MGLYEDIQESAQFLRARLQIQPKVGIILGTGLGDLAQDISQPVVIPYGEIPHFPVSTVQSHKGQLVAGLLAGVPVLAMQGRFHFYEGYTLQQVTFPVRVMRALGLETLIVSNACGALNPQYSKGDIMLMEDHINLLGDNPLIGKNDERLGVRFPDMSEPYARDFIEKAREAATELKIPVQKGVYVAVSGPCLETRAEYRFLRTIGADVVGMSTVPEVIVARHGGMKCLGFSIITDMCLPDAIHPVTLEEIIAVGNAGARKMRAIVQKVLPELAPAG